MSSSDLDQKFFQRLGTAATTCVTAPLKTIQEFVNDIVDADERLRNADSFGDRLISWLTLPGRVLFGLVSFVLFSWSSTRSGLAFLLGAPAVIAIVGYFSGLLAADMTKGHAKMVATNEAYYQMHTERFADHPEWAEIFGERLVEESPGEPKYKYYLALAQQRSGKLDQAVELMESIAPRDRRGYGRAHLWLANHQLGDFDDQGKLTADPDELALLHFRHARTAMPESAEPPFRIATMYERNALRFEETDPRYVENLILADQEYQRVIRKKFAFEDAMEKDREKLVQLDLRIKAIAPAARVRVKLSKLDPENYDPIAVRDQINTQIKNLLPTVQLKAANFPELWGSLVSCALEIEDYGQAWEILAEGMKLSRENDDTRTQAALLEYSARALVIQANRVKNLERRDNYERRLKILCQAVTNNPRNGAAYRMLLDFIVPAAPDVNKEPAETALGSENPAKTLGATNGNAGSTTPDRVPIRMDWLRANGAGTINTGIISAMVGIHEMASGNVAAGKKNWEIGSDFDSKTKYYIFQLLNTAAVHRKDAFPHLYDMMTQSIEMFSEMPELYFARATFLKNKQRFEEAIIDFQQYNKLRPKDYLGLQMEKLCFATLGNDDKVIELDTRIDEIQGTLSESNRKKSSMQLKLIEKNF